MFSIISNWISIFYIDIGSQCAEVHSMAPKVVPTSKKKVMTLISKN
jgi:hypothetical protein